MFENFKPEHYKDVETSDLSKVGQTTIESERDKVPYVYTLMDFSQAFQGFMKDQYDIDARVEVDTEVKHVSNKRDENSAPESFDCTYIVKLSFYKDKHLIKEMTQSKTSHFEKAEDEPDVQENINDVARVIVQLALFEMFQPMADLIKNHDSNASDKEVKPTPKNEIN